MCEPHGGRQGGGKVSGSGEPSYCRRCGVRLASGGVAGYCPECARELVAYIKRVMPPQPASRVASLSPRRPTVSRATGGLLYTTREQCPVCGNSFEATRVAMSRLRVESRDPDFYVRYTPLDPNQYQVWVCPGCGYAAPQGVFAPLLPDERERAAAASLRLRQEGGSVLEEVLPGWKEPTPDARGDGDEQPLVRPLAEVVADYARALYFARCRRRRHGIAGGLYLRLAWIHRTRGDEEGDRRLSARALEEYILAYEGEEGLPGQMDELSAAYLIGVLCMRTGRLQEAARYLARVVSARSGAEPGLRKMARERWSELQDLWPRRDGESAPPPQGMDGL